jgi:hypothetical protein
MLGESASQFWLLSLNGLEYLEAKEWGGFELTIF